MKNFERIKQMSVEDMVEFFCIEHWGLCSSCAFNEKEECNVDPLLCRQGVKQWLESEGERNVKN